MAVSFFIVNLVYLEANGAWGFVAVGLGLIACVNLYIWGQFSRETNKKAPGMFLLFRALQGILVFIFDAMAWKYFATYILMDLIYFSVLLYDSRFIFVYREPKNETNSKIRRV